MGMGLKVKHLSGRPAPVFVSYDLERTTPLREQGLCPCYKPSDFVEFENPLLESIPLVDRCFLFVNKKASRNVRPPPKQQPNSQEIKAAVLLFR